jgi:prepilin-type N-terminal cleavage/methylation domain-containing protein
VSGDGQQQEMEMAAMGSGRGEGGFTLVEVLIALTISSIIAASLISLLVGQSRFYNRTDHQMNAEQVAQATFDLLSTELRMATGSDLLAAESDSLALRFDVLQAIVCDPVSSSAAAIYVFDRTTNAGLTGSFVGIAVSGPYETDFAYADSWNPTPTATGAGPQSTCVLAGVPGTGPSSDYLEINGWSSQFGAVPERGAFVRAYGRLSYHIAASSFLPAGWAVWRGNQELVGPFESGAAFAYVMSDGSVQSSVLSSDFDDVVAVRLTATAVGDGSNPYGVSRPVDFELPFRN